MSGSSPRHFRVAAVVTAVTLVLGYALAYFLSRAAPAWRGLFMFLVIAPLMTGVIVRTYGWIVLLGIGRARQPRAAWPSISSLGRSSS